MERDVTFSSDGLKLTGILNIPDGLEAGEKRPAIIVLHGFGSNKGSPSCIWPAREFAKWGYVTLRFDMRSCGDSEGEPNHINCLEQVEDTKNAISFMQGLDEVDADRIGLIGSSFGAAVTVYTAGVDDRVKAAISSGGWGDGERKFRGQPVGSVVQICNPAESIGVQVFMWLSRDYAHIKETHVRRWLMLTRDRTLRLGMMMRKHIEFLVEPAPVLVRPPWMFH